MAGPELQNNDARILSVRNLSVELSTDTGNIQVLDHVDFDMEEGETLGVVGESGSGKTMTALAVMGLLHQVGGQITGGSIVYRGHELVGLKNSEMNRFRGAGIGMIFQQPRRSLDPSFTVGDQIAEGLRTHLGLSRKAAWKRAVEMLDLVQIPSAANRALQYPHQFSGGMCQRVMLAIALAPGPKILIADEPTTALDVTVQAQIIALLNELQREMGLSILFVTHDLSVIAEVSDRVLVLYAGQIVEQSDARAIFQAPQHPYTAALLKSNPTTAARSLRLEGIPGLPPTAESFPSGCRFHPRCSYAIARCAVSRPELADAKHGSRSRCLRHEEIELGIH